jgi:hypothetical protein
MKFDNYYYKRKASSSCARILSSRSLNENIRYFPTIATNKNPSSSDENGNDRLEENKDDKKAHMGKNVKSVKKYSIVIFYDSKESTTTSLPWAVVP